nr:PKD domain-containing protein [Thiothrix nivea]
MTADAKYFFNKPPVAGVGSDQTVAQNESIRLDGSSSYDPDGSIIAYEWRYGSNVVSHDAIFTLDPLPPGAHVLNLTVTDDDGAKNDKSVTITVSDAENCSGVATQEGYIEVTLAWTDQSLNMDLSTDLSQQVGNFDIQDADCLLEHYYIPVGAEVSPGSYPVKVAYTGSPADKNELNTIVTIKVPGSNQSRMVSLNLLDDLTEGKIADIVISEDGVEFVPVDNFEREAVVLYNRTENSEIYVQAYAQFSAGSQTSSTEYSSGWSGQLPQQGYSGNVLFDVIWNISQAILGGPLAGAQIDLFDADGYNTVLDDGSSSLYTTTASYGSSAYTAGIIVVPGTVRAALQDDKLYVVRVRGGADIDPDSDQQVNSGVVNSQASLHALVTGAELKALGFKVNILTEFAYQLGKGLLGGERAALRSRMNQTSRCLLSNDMNADGAINHLDALVWTPNGNTGKLFRPYHDNFLPIMARMRNGENVYADMFNLAAKPVLEGGSFTIQEDLARGSAIGQVKYCALEQAPTAYRISGAGAENFQIGTDGVLSLSATASLDYETQRIYTLYVTGSNDYGDSLPVTVYVTVTADGSPLLGTLDAFVTEGAVGGTEVGTLPVTAGASPVTAIRLVGTGAGNFAVSSAGVMTVKTGAQFDHALVPNYTLQAIATNAAGDSGPAQVKIKVYDDVPTLPSPFYARITEEIPGGTRLGRLGYYPGLTPINAFTVSGIGAERFTVDTGGYIHIAGNSNEKPIQNDNISTYRLQVTATNDRGTSAPVDMTVDVLQSSDANALVVNNFSTDVFIHTPNNTAVGIVGYTYALHPASTFELSGDDSAGFAILANGTLVLTDNSVLEGKAGQELSFTVKAGNAYGAESNTATIKINVKDDVPKLYPMSSSILEGSVAGTKVGKLGYSYGVSPIVQFTLTGEGAEQFAIDGNGLVTVAEGANLSRASTAVYSLTAQATNSLGRTAATSVNITVYSSAPTLRSSSIAVIENSVVGERVAIVPVVTIGNSAITGFTLSGTGSEAFAVDAQGYVTVADSSLLDAEQVSGFDLQVTATNTQGASEPVALTITVTDIPDGAVPTVNAGADQSVYRGDTVTLTAEAADSDGTIASYVWKEGSTVLSNASSFAKADFGVGTHTITLTVTDDDGNQVTDTVTVTVSVIVDNDPPHLTLSGDSIVVVKVGNAYTEPGASARDDVDGVVAVNISGTVNTAEAGDYTLTYTATDNAGNTATKTRLVRVVTDNMTLLGSIRTSGGYVFDIALSNDGTKIFAAGYLAGLIIFDITNPAQPYVLSSFDTDGEARGVTLSADNKRAYVADSDKGLKVIDVSNPASPSLSGTYSITSGETWGVTLSKDEKVAYLSNVSDGIDAVDISNLGSMSSLGKVSGLGVVWASKLSGDGEKLYVAAHSGGMKVLDVRNPENISIIGSIQADYARYLTLSSDESKAFVAAQSGGMKVVDITNPSSLSLLGEYSALSSIQGIDLSNDETIAFVADSSAGLHMVDISTANNPALISSFNTPGNALRVQLSNDGSKVYVADWSGGLLILGVVQ